MSEELRSFSFGSCAFERLSPPAQKIQSNTKIINIKLTLEEALKINLAIDECIRKIHRYKGSSSAGKRALVNIAVHIQKRRITINEDQVPKQMSISE